MPISGHAKGGNDHERRTGHGNHRIVADQLRGRPAGGHRPRSVKTLKNVEGAWIQEQKVVVRNGKISEYRVNIKVTFVLED